MWIYSLRVWNRLLPAVARHKREWLIHELTTQARLEDLVVSNIPIWLNGLFLIDIDMALRELVRVLPDQNQNLWRIRVPVTIRPPFVPITLTSLELICHQQNPHTWSESDSLWSVPLQAVAAVADDTDSVRRLYNLLSTHPDAPHTYDSLSEVAHRAKVRVMTGGRLIELSS